MFQNTNQMINLQPTQIEPRDWSFAFSFGTFEFSLGDGISFGPAGAGAGTSAIIPASWASLPAVLHFAPGVVDSKNTEKMGILGEDDGGLVSLVPEESWFSLF